MTGPQSYPLACAAARVLPGAADPALARFAATLAARLRPDRERAARQNLAVLSPDWNSSQVARAARAAHTAYARFLIEYLRHAGRPEGLGRRAEFVADDSFHRARREGRGIVVGAAHVGNWEVGALALAATGASTMVVTGEQYAPAWQERVRRDKLRAGLLVVGRGESPRRLWRHLSAGGAVCLLVDGDVFGHGWPARVGGRRVLLPNGPARLAAGSGSLLAGALCHRTRAGFRVELESLESPPGAAARDPRALHAAVAAWLERTLARHADEWCLFRPFFPTEGGGA